jgi:hypothetical protein
MKIKLTESKFRSLLFEIINTVVSKNYENAKVKIINYIKSFGQKGKLPSFNSSINEMWYKYFDEAYQWVCESLPEVAKNGPAWIKRNLKIMINSKWTYNKRNLIYVERSIDFLFNNDTLTIDDLNYKSIGECWSWKRRNSTSYCSNLGLLDSRFQVIICGYVHPESIDWVETIYTNLYKFKNETEIRMNENAFVEVSYILINGVKYSMNGSYIINASADKYNKNRENW